jgi:hypothetical protein
VAFVTPWDLALLGRHLAAWEDWISYFVRLVAAICAIVFGAKARRLAKAGAQGRIAATIGLVLGIAFIVLSILAGPRSSPGCNASMKALCANRLVPNLVAGVASWILSPSGHAPLTVPEVTELRLLRSGNGEASPPSPRRGLAQGR